jgi:prepilin-type N-terminal cleavage/methylation domain-containing protein
MRRLSTQRGDTLIEVMVAFAVFAMVAVGAITVMNQGTANAQDTLETTQVRQQIDNQAEMLRFLHQSYLANPSDATAGSLQDKFRSLVTLAKNAESAGVRNPTDFGAACTDTIPGDSAYRFVLDPSTGARLTASNVLPANATSAPPYARVTPGPSGLSSYGLWIEPILSNANINSGTAQYVDFHIRACWNSAGSSPQRTLGTIVRLYVPDNVDTGTSGGEETVIPTPPPNEFTIAGAFANPCYPHNDLEGEDTDGNPGFSPFNPGFINTTNPAVACQRPGSSVYNCSNYDAQYSTGLPADGSSNGRYDMTINYYDADCGDGSISSPFTFKVAVYKDGQPLAPISELSLSSSSTSRTIDVGEINQNTKIQIRWWNNHHFSGGDPDFAISQLIFKRKA